MITPKTAFVFILIALVLGVGLYVMYPTPERYETPRTEKLSTSTPESTNTFPPGAILEDGTIVE